MVEAKFKNTDVGLIPQDWTVEKLGELTSLMTNGFVGTAKIHYTESDTGVTYVQGFNVLENSFDYTGIKKVNLRFHKAHLRSELKYKDLLTIQTGDVGLTAFVPKELEGANCHALIISRFKPQNIESKFVSFYLNSKSGRLRLKDIETGTTMKHINVGDFQNFQIPLPTLQEQQAISEVLSDTDTWIDCLEKLIAKKQFIKQGTMQQLLTPKEDWEIKKLGEILTFGSGKDYKHLKKGNIPVYGTGGLMTFVDSYLYDGDSVGIGRKGTIDKPVFLNGRFWTVDTLFYTYDFIECLPKYIYYQFQQIRWKDYNEASGVPSLNKNTLEQIEIRLPNLTGQTHIATILSDMDNEIESLKQKLIKAKQIKQGLMQELLTGKIRLV